MKRGPWNFATLIEYEGYVEAGKAHGVYNRFHKGTEAQALHERGWAVRQAEMNEPVWVDADGNPHY